MAEDLTRPGAVQLAQLLGEVNTNPDVVAVTQPPDGGEVTLPSLPDRVYNLKFDPQLAQVRVIDVDGDGDLDVVMLFNADTPDESRIVFVDMVEATQSGTAPLLQVGETQFGADIVVQQAQALAGEEPTLLTAAPPGPQPVGTGETRYSDDFGDTNPLLGPQGVIPGVVLDFPSLETQEVPEDDLVNFLATEGPPPGTEVPGDGEPGSEGPGDGDPGDGPDDPDDPGTGDLPEASIVGAPVVAEGAFAVFTIVLSDQSAFDSTLNVTVSDSGSGIGFATGGTGEPADYLNTTLEFFDGTNWVPFANGSSVTVPAGDTALQVRVTTLDDAGNPIFEGPEAFQIALSDAGDPGVTVNATPATGTINDDDSVTGGDPGGDTGDVPDVTIGDASANEGDRLVFTVTLSNPSFEAITLALSTAGSGVNPATDGIDYENVNFEVSTNGVDWVAAGGADATEITFAPAATQLFVRIDSFIDDLNEMDETFTLSATATAGTIGTVTNGTGTIIDTTPILVVGSDGDDTGTTGPTHAEPNPVPGAPDQGAIIGGGGGDVLIGDPGGALFGDLNVAIILDISGSMVNPDNNPAPNVTRLDVVQDALEKILPQLASRDSVVNLFIETFSTDADDPLFIGELTTANVDEIIADILALDEEAGGFTNFEAPLTDMQDWYLDQIAITEGFSNVAYFLTDGQPNRWLDDDGNVAGTGFGFQPIALSEAIAAIPDVLDRDSGTFSGDDQILLNAIGMSNALENSLDLLDNTEVVDPGPPQVGEAQIVSLGDPSAVPDEFLVVGLGVGADEITGRDGDDVIFGDVPNSDALATAEGIDLPPGSGWFVFESLEAGESPSSPNWDRNDTIAYLRDPANQSLLIGGGRGENDTIDGGGGDDVIFGQGGDDSLTGGAGADTFVYTLTADEGNDEILDFSTDEGDLLSFVNVTDADSSGTLGIEDVVDGFVDGGGAGAVDTLTLVSGTMIMITDATGDLTDLASIEANSLINGAMA